jgi:hypothetical protein
MASKIQEPIQKLERRFGRLRLTLLILLLGFAIDGIVEAYNAINHTYPLPFASSVFIIGPFVTLTGLAILWIGRSEWDERTSRRFRLAQRAFGLSLVAIALAGLPVLYYGLNPATTIPWYVEWEFGAAILAMLVLNFIIYVLVAFDLTEVFGKVLLLISLAWASVVTIFLGQALAKEFGTIVLAIQDRTFNFRPVSSSVSGIESYFVVAYILLTIVYLDAYRRSGARATKSS